MFINIEIYIESVIEKIFSINLSLRLLFCYFGHKLEYFTAIHTLNTY